MFLAVFFLFNPKSEIQNREGGIMQRKLRKRLFQLTGLSLILVFVAGADTPEKKSQLNDPEPQRAISVEKSAIQVSDKQMVDYLDLVVFKDEKIYFTFNSAYLGSKTRTILKRKAEWLTRHPDLAVTLEGHCDSLGSEKSNFALGHDRAESVKSYLIKQGVKSLQLNTVSLGDQALADRGDSEEAYARNRRVEFVLD